MSHSVFLANSYGDYETAADRSVPNEKPMSPVSLLPNRVISRLLKSILLIFLHCFYPYLVLGILILSIFSGYTAIGLFIVLHLIRIIQSTRQTKTSTPGLYFCDNHKNKRIIANSPTLLREYSRPGSITRDYGFTPWIMTGDLCTLIPYITNYSPRQPYQRRWIRVPLSHGPLDNLAGRDECGDFEAVAIDYVLTMPATDKCLLIFAGLSGGSNEGYCLDLVDSAVKRGWSCFVMLGRGLAEDQPCYSNALFHGARTSDAVAVAKIMKESFQVPVMIAGISLGGVIVNNGLARDVFGDDVDAGVSISGSCDTKMIENCIHSRQVWQPILAHGLKDAFTVNPITLVKLKKVLGPEADTIIQDIGDIFEFDSSIVTSLNGFRDVYHYYDDVSALPERISVGLRHPLLTIHAMDDPITFVDMSPSHALRGSKFSRPLSAHMFALITSVGGHVGWPVGWLPWNNRWEFQNRVTLDFLESCLILQRFDVS